MVTYALPPHYWPERAERLEDMAKVKDPLPGSLSGLIVTALQDLAKVEKKRKQYIVEMPYTFHEVENKKCVVCFAGAVMACSLGANPEQTVNPFDFGTKIQGKLYALDNLRIGDTVGAWGQIHPGTPVPPKLYELARKITPYAKDKRAFKKEMTKLAHDLKAIGQ